VYDAETEELVTLLTNKIWQEQDMCNSPYGQDAEPLRDTLADQPGAESLLALKAQLEEK
jgi:hypothetical protein